MKTSDGAADCSGSFGCTGSNGPEEVLFSKETPADFAMVDGVDEPVNSFFFSGSVTSSCVLLLNGVDPAFEVKLAGFWPNIELDAGFSDVEFSSFVPGAGAGLFRLKRSVDVVVLLSSAVGENRPLLDWLSCGTWKPELD